MIVSRLQRRADVTHDRNSVFDDFRCRFEAPVEPFYFHGVATGFVQESFGIGNRIFGILLFEPNIFGTTARAFSWGSVKLLVDNFEQYYPLSDWETLVGRYSAFSDPDPMRVSDHQHVENLAAAYAQFATTDGVVFAGKTFAPDSYGYMDFDPLVNDEFLLETMGHADVKLRGFADAGAPNATVLWYPGELVDIQ